MALPEVTAKLTADAGDFIRAWNQAAAAATKAAAQIRAALAAASGNIDVGGFSKLREELDKVAGSARRAGDGVREFGGSSKKSGADLGELAQGASKAAGALGGAAGGAGGLLSGLTKNKVAMAAMAAAVLVLLGLLPAAAAAVVGLGAALQGIGVVAGVVIGGWRGIEQAGQRLKASLGGLQKQLESTFRSQLSGEMQKLGHAISSMDGPLKAIARSVSGVVKEFTGWIRSSEGMKQIEALLGGVDNMVKNLAPGAKALAQAFTTFGEAAAPSLGKIGDALSSVFENLNKVIQKNKESGQLQKAFEAGAAAIEAFGEVLAGIVDVLIEVAGSAGKPAAEAIKSFGKALQDAAPYIGTFFQFLALGMQILGKVAELLAKVLKATEPLQRMFQQAGEGFSEFMKNMDVSKIDGATKAIGGFAAILGTAVKKGVEDAVKAVKKWWDDTTKEIKKGVDDAIKSVKKWWDDTKKGVEKGVQDAIKAIKKWWTDTVREVTKGVANAIAKVVAFADGVVKAIEDGINDFIDTVKKWWDETLKSIQEAVDKCVEEIKKLPEKAIDAIKQKINDFKQAGKDIGDGLAQGIEGSSFVQTAKSVAEAALNAIKGTLGIRSPSVVMRDEVGMMMGAGVAQGIISSAGLVTDAMRRTGLAAVAAGRVGAGAAAAGRGSGQQIFTVQVGAGADSAMGTAIARLAQQGKLKITANAVVGGRR